MWANEDLLQRFYEVDHRLKALSLNLVDELAKGSKLSAGKIPKEEQLHFPGEDVIDSSTGSQYFLHRHASDLIKDSTHIHFFKRWNPKELNLPKGDTIPTHLAALEIDKAGEPVGWFLVNQWVVADYWQEAGDTIDLFRDWKIKSPDVGRGDDVNPICHEWLEAFMKVNLDTHLRELLNERDQKLDELVELNPGKNVLEDKTIEIFGYKNLSNVIFQAQ